MQARNQLARLRRQIERRAVPALELDLPIGRFARLHFLGRFGQDSPPDDLAVTGVDETRLFANLSLRKIGQWRTRPRVEQARPFRGLRTPDRLTRKTLTTDFRYPRRGRDDPSGKASCRARVCQ